MNKHKSSFRYRSQLVSGIFLRYLLTLVIFAALLLGGGLLCWEIAQRIVWQPDSLLYQLLTFARDYVMLVAGTLLVAGWSVITIVYLSKPFHYLDEIITAAEALANPSDEMIRLPAALQDVQNEFNAIREQSLHNAFAAREAEQRKNDLIVYLAHDLKTPLTSVIGYLTLLRDEPDISIETRARYTGIALDKALRLEELISEFFEITRFNLSVMTLESEPINLSRMLEQIASEFLPILNEKGLTWALSIEPNMTIEGDPDKLARVFDNLARNAVAYSHPQTPIALTACVQGSTAKIVVENRGKTIPPEKLERIFDQFFRLDEARSTSTGGAGLGLAIAKQIIELHGGSIRARSEDDFVAFTVHLPLRRQKIVRNSAEGRKE